MSKSAQKHRDHQAIDGRDRIMESVASVSGWAERNRRIATFGLIAVVLVVAAGVYYVRYRGQLAERAAVQLDDIRLTARGATPDQLREQLRLYIDQFGGARQADEARVLLAEMELQRDSIDSAMRLLEQAADLDGGPVGYYAAAMIATAEEQRGDLDAAERQYQRLAAAAQYDFQRRKARASLARLHVYRGDYPAAEKIYAELAEETDGETDGEAYAMRLGEVRARAAAKLPPPELPVAVASAGPRTGLGGAAVPVGDSAPGSDSVATAGTGSDSVAAGAVGSDTSP